MRQKRARKHISENAVYRQKTKNIFRQKKNPCMKYQQIIVNAKNVTHTMQCRIIFPASK